MVAEIAIGQPEHESIPQSFDLLTGRGLRNAAGKPSARLREVRHGNVVRASKAGLVRMGKIHMEIKFLQLIGAVAELQIVIGSPRGWRRGTVEIGRKQTGDVR